MRFEAVTIKDIAKALGFSTSTVSRALRDSYEISADTKQQVLAFARKANYQPNPIALSLREKRSGCIGVVVAEIANSFFSEVISGIESVAHEQGYNIIISQTRESYEQEVKIMQFLSSRSVDGCLVSVSAETQDTQHFTRLHQHGFPLVFFDRILDDMDTHKVTTDNYQGAYEATIHLLENGNKCIGVIAPAKHLSIARQRLAGYAQALHEYGLAPDKSYIQHCLHGGLHFTQVEEAANRLLRLPCQPDAILTLTEKLTTGFVRYCKQNNILIPEQLRLAGFSNLDLTELLTPALSVVRQPAFDIGKQSAELLFKTIAAKQPLTSFQKLVLPSEFHARDSSIKTKNYSLNKLLYE